MCQSLLKISLSVLSDETTNSASSSHLCTNLDNQKKLNGTPLKRTSPNNRVTDNNIQYSYGWIGTKCEATIDFILVKGTIFLYDGKGMLSDFDNTEHCKHPKWQMCNKYEYYSMEQHADHQKMLV